MTKENAAKDGAKKQTAGRTWLVKSGDRILGPFAVEEVAQKLRSKEFVVIDEVVSPMSRWRYIRDEPTFLSVVEEIRRGLMASREDTEVQGYTQTHTETDEGTATETDPALLEVSSVSPLSSSATKVMSETSPVRDAEFTETVISSRAVTTADKPSPVRQYGVSNGSAVKKSVSRFTTVLWAAAAVAVGVAGYLVVQSRSVSRQTAHTERGDELKVVLAKARRAWDFGDFTEALKMYREANQISPGRTDVSLREAILMLKLEGQTVAAKRALEGALTQATEPVLEQEAKIGLGLAALATEDFVEAERRFLDASLRGPHALIAKFNAGVAAYMARSFEQAAHLFRDAGDEPAAVVMLARSALASSGSETVQLRREAEERLETLLKSQADFRQEALIVASYMDVEAGNRKRALARAKAAFDADPFLTAEHLHSPLLSLDAVEWRSLVSLCREISDKVKAPVTRALLAICMEKSGQREESVKMITDGLSSTPDDPSLHMANAYMLLISGREEDAKASLRMASRAEAPLLAVILTGRVCRRLHDSACASDAWTKLGVDQPSDLAALIGLAEIKNEQGASAQAEALIERALRLSPRYLPAIRMRERGKVP